MKGITVKIEEKQYIELKNLCKKYNIKNVSWFIRRSIDVYLQIERKEDSL